MSRLFVNQIKENDVVKEVYCVSEKALRPNKNNVYYLQFFLSDRTGSVAGRFWNATEEISRRFSDGDFVLVEGNAQRYQGNLQVIATKLAKVDPQTVSLEDFSRAVRIDVNALWNRVRAMLSRMKNSRLVELAERFLDDEKFADRFSKTFAGVRLHHAYPGGLLEHTATMMELALRVAPLYADVLDADLLLLGVFLHDIGKTVELSDDSNAPVYTDSGQALGHPYLGAEMLREKIAEWELLSGETFDPRLATVLKHMILSHHGSAENGAAKAPMSLEALALHYIDSLDAKLNEFQKYLFDDPNVGSFWTTYVPGIERKLMKTFAISDENAETP